MHRLNFIFLTFLLVATATSLGSANTDHTIIRIIPDGQLTVDDDYMSVGVSLSRDVTGNLYMLMENPSQVAVWDDKFDQSSIFPLETISIPSDINSFGLQAVYVTDFASSTISRFNRYLDQQSDIDLTTEYSQSELISICRTGSGLIYVIDRIERDILSVNIDGSVGLRGSEIVKGGWLDNPLKIRYADHSEQLVMMDGTELIVCSEFGVYRNKLPTNMRNPVGFNILNDEVWTIGDQLHVINLKTGEPMFSISSDSLKILNVNSPKDILPYSDDILFILENESSTITRFIILRNQPSDE